VSVRDLHRHVLDPLHHLVHIGVGPRHADASTGANDSQHLAQHLELRRRVHNHLVRHHCVKTVVCVRQVERVARFEFDVAQRKFGSLVSGKLQRIFVEIHTDDAAIAEPTRCFDRHVPGAGAHIEDAGTGREGPATCFNQTFGAALRAVEVDVVYGGSITIRKITQKLSLMCHTVQIDEQKLPPIVRPIQIVALPPNWMIRYAATFERAVHGVIYLGGQVSRWWALVDTSDWQLPSRRTRTTD
jgi:hypothetical protein